METHISGVLCVGSSLIFNIFDPLKFVPTPNPFGAYGSFGPPCISSRLWNFEYSYMSSTSRKTCYGFYGFDSQWFFCCSKKYVGNTQTTNFIDAWKADTALYGSGNSLYNKLKNARFR